MSINWFHKDRPLVERGIRNFAKLYLSLFFGTFTVAALESMKYGFTFDSLGLGNMQADSLFIALMFHSFVVAFMYQIAWGEERA